MLENPEFPERRFSKSVPHQFDTAAGDIVSLGECHCVTTPTLRQYSGRCHIALPLADANADNITPTMEAANDC